MKFRAVQQLAENLGNLRFDNARPVVLHADLVAVGAGGFDVDPNLGQDAGFLAGVERVVDRFLDGGEQGLARIVETEQVPVLGKKFADRNVALAGGHRLGRGPAAVRFASRLAATVGSAADSSSSSRIAAPRSGGPLCWGEPLVLDFLIIRSRCLALEVLGSCSARRPDVYLAAGGARGDWAKLGGRTESASCESIACRARPTKNGGPGLRGLVIRYQHTLNETEQANWRAPGRSPPLTYAGCRRCRTARLAGAHLATIPSGESIPIVGPKAQRRLALQHAKMDQLPQPSHKDSPLPPAAAENTFGVAAANAMGRKLRPQRTSNVPIARPQGMHSRAQRRLATGRKHPSITQAYTSQQPPPEGGATGKPQALRRSKRRRTGRGSGSQGGRTMSHTLLRGTFDRHANALVAGGLRPPLAQQPQAIENDVQDRLTGVPSPSIRRRVLRSPPKRCPPDRWWWSRRAAAVPPPSRPPLPLFYNYYVGPPGVPAQMYPMPRPTPEFVGRVWITYPPFMPNEYLYHHHRRYYRFTPSGYNSASVRYSSGIMGFIPAF